MNDEIKEILEELKRRNERYNYCLKNDISFSDEDYQAHLLLNYITYLQQELQSTQEKWDKDKQWVECRTKEWLDYKTRCEKAIVKIKMLGAFDGKYCTRNFKMMSADFNDLLNILQGSDEKC